MQGKDVKRLGAGVYPIQEIDVSFGIPRDNLEPAVQVFVDQGEAMGVVAARRFNVVWVKEDRAMVVVSEDGLTTPVLKLPRRVEQVVYRSVRLPDEPNMRGEQWRVKPEADEITGYIGAALELITGT